MNRLLFFLSMIIIYFSADCLQAKDQPDFLIIGVTKCGTTTLYQWMTQHPDIHAREPKELHFFDKKINYKKGLASYQQQFSDKQISGDATPGYFWKKGCLEKISKYCSRSKLILIFRDPVKRVISGYFMHRRKNKGPESFEEFITGKAKVKNCLLVGMYASNLKHWLNFFQKEQIHIMFLEEMAANPEDELNKVFRFLGLSDYRLENYENQSKTSYSTQSIKPATIALLKNLYKPHNEALAKMLGRELPWKE